MQIGDVVLLKSDMRHAMTIGLKSKDYEGYWWCYFWPLDGSTVAHIQLPESVLILVKPNK
jgi:hypothetical protein